MSLYLYRFVRIWVEGLSFILFFSLFCITFFPIIAKKIYRQFYLSERENNKHQCQYDKNNLLEYDKDLDIY